MASLFELVNQLSVLQAGRRPEWVAQVDAAQPNGAPVPGSGVGQFLKDALKTLIKVSPREETYRRTGRITLPVFDLATTYTVDIDGNPVPVAAVVDLPTTIAAIVADINADVGPGAGDVVLASPEESGGVGTGVDTVLLQGLAEADYIVTLSAAGGAGTIAAVLDYASTKARIWFAGKQVNALIGSDYLLANGASYDVDRRGFIERFDTGGLDRAYVELHTLVAPADDDTDAEAAITYRNPTILIGPGVEEVTVT
jgi:hypothetical protein